MLRGTKVVELPGLVPVQYCGKLLAEWGAEVLVLRTREVSVPAGGDALARLFGERKWHSVLLQPKEKERDAAVVRRVLEGADVLLDPWRPGALEGLVARLYPTARSWPPPALARLIIVRLSGYGQPRTDDATSQSLARSAGHDINYLALSGILAHSGRRPGAAGDRPVPPANVIADFGGAALAAGTAAAARVRQLTTGSGVIIDAGLTQAAAHLGSFVYEARSSFFSGPPGTNLLDGAVAPFYRTYETADGRFVAVGAIEPKFYGAMLRGVGLGDDERIAGAAQWAVADWPAQAELLAAAFASRSRAEWEDIYWGTDACVTPVLEATEVAASRWTASLGVLDDRGAPAGLVVSSTPPDTHSLPDVRSWLRSDYSALVEHEPTRSKL
jgi:alpha-methylacyl-CoA racemase